MRNIIFPPQDEPIYLSHPASVDTASIGLYTRLFPDDIERCRISCKIRPNTSLVGNLCGSHVANDVADTVRLMLCLE